MMHLGRTDQLSTSGAPGGAVADAVRVSDARPLYLVTPTACELALDGPALAVRRQRQALARYPLQRVSRVISALSVTWQPGALAACLERGIPVVLLDGSGSPVGHVQPVATVRSSLDQLLNEWVACGGWQRSRDNWLRSERMRAVRSWVAARATQGNSVDVAQEREAVRRFVYAAEWRQTLLDQPGIYRAALLALSAQQVRAAGLQCSYVSEHAGELDLAAEICDLLCVVLELELCGLGQQVPTQTRARLRIIETYTAGLEHRCRSILGRLHRRVSEALRAWR
jgi:hypothetical protein